MSQIQELGKKAKGATKGNTQGKDSHSIKSAIHYVLTNYSSDSVERGQAMKAVVTRALEDALNGDKAAREWIADRYEGKAQSDVKVDL